MPLLEDQRLFFRQFRERFGTTGSVIPSSRFLAKAMASNFEKHEGPARILEIGPGTGAVTKRLVKRLKPGDRLDMVELNEDFGNYLKKQFETNPAWQPVADQCEVHICPLQEFTADEPYDYIISGLPHAIFPPELVDEVFGLYFQHLAPEGVFCYFEYMFIRPLKMTVSPKRERQRIREVGEVMTRWLKGRRFRKSWVYGNFPPAWVQHLRHPEAT